MKTFIVLVLVFTPFFNSFAQPGDEHNYFRFTEFKNVQDSIKKYPKDQFYRWVRLEILFKTRFQLQTKSTLHVKDYFKYFDLYREYEGPDSIIVYVPQPCHMCPSRQEKIWNPTREMGDFLIENTSQLIKELDVLIKQGTTIKQRHFYLYNYYCGYKAAYLYKRGQLNYLIGKPEKAKEDYLSALENEPDNDLKKEILISIAAYYFTQDSVTEESQRQALKYLDFYTAIAGFNPHYETEKINLLKSLKDSITLVTYFQDQAARCWRHYYENLKYEAYKGDRSMADAMKYEQLLFEYLIELNPEFTMEEFKKHKDIITGKL